MRVRKGLICCFYTICSIWQATKRIDVFTCVWQESNPPLSPTALLTRLLVGIGKRISNPEHKTKHEEVIDL